MKSGCVIRYFSLVSNACCNLKSGVNGPKLLQIRNGFTTSPGTSVRTYAQEFSGAPRRSKRGLYLGAATVLGGAAIGSVYAYNEVQKKNTIKVANPGTGLQSLLSEHPPKEKVAKKICSPVDNTGLKLVLYQYQSCPFCTKVRTFLDYFGFSYEIVEVNPVMKTELKWSKYKKVPILIAKVDGGYQQLVDSSLIVSVLMSLLYDKKTNLEDMIKFYPMVEFQDDDGKKSTEIMNKYFLMLGDSLPEGRTKEQVAEERKWRRWVDDTLVHQLSPNVYRSWDESLQAFNYFSAAGDWENIFSDWQRMIVIYVGAAAMYFVGRRLKKDQSATFVFLFDLNFANHDTVSEHGTCDYSTKRFETSWHNLKDDVRLSLYDEVNIWLRALQKKGTPFMGGQTPDLSDLGVYACLNSIEGCRAFQDLLANTKIRPWYERMRNAVGSRQGMTIFTRG